MLECKDIPVGVRVHLAARYSRREELCLYRADLARLGYFVTSRWLDGSHEVGGDGLSVEAARADHERFAREDWEDVTTADVVISFTEPPRSKPGRGGRHVEFGVAMALGKLCVIIGPRENVFHCLPGIVHHDDWSGFLGRLDGVTEHCFGHESNTNKHL